MRGMMRALAGLAAASALTSCGLVEGRLPAPGGAAPAPAQPARAAARFGLLSPVVCPEVCRRFAARGNFDQANDPFDLEVFDRPAGDAGTIEISLDGVDVFADPADPPEVTIVGHVVTIAWTLSTDGGTPFEFVFVFDVDGTPSATETVNGAPRQGGATFTFEGPTVVDCVAG